MLFRAMSRGALFCYGFLLCLFSLCLDGDDAFERSDALASIYYLFIMKMYEFVLFNGFLFECCVFYLEY